jgi:hypothetical protein
MQYVSGAWSLLEANMPGVESNRSRRAFLKSTAKLALASAFAPSIGELSDPEGASAATSPQAVAFPKGFLWVISLPAPIAA